MSANQLSVPGIKNPINADGSCNNKVQYLLNSNDIKIGREIGKGAFSVVYTGEYNGRIVAVKCQPKDQDGNVPAYVSKEIEALQRFQHPQILRFIGAADNTKAKQIWIISEQLGQPDLDLLLKNVRSCKVTHPGWGRLLHIALDAAMGIQHLHSHRCVHRDIKASNILLSNDYRAKLCDFGFVMDLDLYSRKGSFKSAGILRKKSYCGTDAYMAPEMYLDDDYDESVDIFSFGVVLMETICCRQANSDGFVLRLPQHRFRIITEEFLSQVPQSCPQMLVDLACECASFEPKSRPSWPHIIEQLRSLILEQQTTSTGEQECVVLKPYISATVPEPQMDTNENGDEVEGSITDDESEVDEVYDSEQQPNRENTAEPVTPSHVGALLKRNRRGNRGWHKKWFILDGANLTYFDMESVQNASQRQQRSTCRVQHKPTVGCQKAYITSQSLTPFTLLLHDCRIWKTMEMPALCFNIVNKNWKTKRELQALNRDDLHLWMSKIEHGITHSNSTRICYLAVPKSSDKDNASICTAPPSKIEQLRIADMNIDSKETALFTQDDDVLQWLKGIGLERYITAFKIKGFSSLEYIRETGIESEDLHLLGIKDSLARKALMEAARELRGDV